MPRPTSPTRTPATTVARFAESSRVARIARIRDHRENGDSRDARRRCAGLAGRARAARRDPRQLARRCDRAERQASLARVPADGPRHGAWPHRRAVRARARPRCRAARVRGPALDRPAQERWLRAQLAMGEHAAVHHDPRPRLRPRRRHHRARTAARRGVRARGPRDRGHAADGGRLQRARRCARQLEHAVGRRACERRDLRRCALVAVAGDAGVHGPRRAGDDTVDGRLRGRHPVPVRVRDRPSPSRSSACSAPSGRPGRASRCSPAGARSA